MGQGKEENQGFKHEMFINQCKVFHTLLFSVATVALMLFADRRTIFSLVSPKNVARGWCNEGFFESIRKISTILYVDM